VADRLAMHFGGRIITTGTRPRSSRKRQRDRRQFVQGTGRGPITEMHNSLRFARRARRGAATRKGSLTMNMSSELRVGIMTAAGLALSPRWSS
jgi:hypothetical protein